MVDRRYRLRRLGTFALSAVGVTGVLLAVWYFLLVDWEAVHSQDLATEARSRVHEGMLLSAAEAQMTGAWHHDTCRYGTFSIHLFYFGSHDLKKVGVVALRTTGAGAQETVTEVGGVENYMLHQFADCSSLDLSSMGASVYASSVSRPVVEMRGIENRSLALVAEGPCGYKFHRTIH